MTLRFTKPQAEKMLEIANQNQFEIDIGIISRLEKALYIANRRKKPGRRPNGKAKTSATRAFPAQETGQTR